MGDAMDHDLIERLKNAGITLQAVRDQLSIAIALDENRGPVVIGDEVPLSLPDGRVVVAKLKPISALFSGHATPPSFAEGPTPEYVRFFHMLERTAANYCVTTKRAERDAEFEAVYNHLRRRPDGKHANPLYSYLRAAARLYMSFSPASQAEFEAVVDRLRKSAKHFALNATTSNYYQLIKNQLGFEDGKETTWPISEMV